MRLLVVDAVQQVQGVLPDRPVRARYEEMGDSSMVLSVEWLVGSIIERRPIVDGVNTALQEALDMAGIEIPFPTQNVNLLVERETVDQLAQTLVDQSPV